MLNLISLAVFTPHTIAIAIELSPRHVLSAFRCYTYYTRRATTIFNPNSASPFLSV
jgi:hypothetical protein